MFRLLKIALVSLAALMLFLSAFAWWAINNETFLKQQASKFVADLTNRDLLINGTLKLSVGSLTTLTLNDVHLSNADWAISNDLLRAEKLIVVLDLLSLFSSQVKIRNIELANLEILLEENDQGETSWDLFPTSQNNQGIQNLPVWIDRMKLDNVVVSHTTPTREVPLDIHINSALLEQQQNQQLTLDVNGIVNTLPLQITGNAGPVNALISGGAFSHQLEITMDEISFNSYASLEDGSSLSGLYLNINFQGPDFAPITTILGVPEFSNDPFELDLVVDDRQGKTRLDLTGNLGDLEVSANGLVDDLLNLTDGQFSIQVSGPNLNQVAETLGVSNLPLIPYKANLDVELISGRTVINVMTVDLDSDQLVVQGELGAAPDFFDSSLSFRMSGSDLTVWDSVLQLQNLEVAPFAIDGTLSNDDQGADNTSLQLNYAGNDLLIEGPLGFPPVFKDTVLAFTLQSSALDRLAGLFGVGGLPEQPIDAQGLVTWTDMGLRLEEVDVSLLDNSATADVLISLGEGFKGSRLEGQFNIPSMATLGELLGQSEFPDLPLQISGNANLVDNGIEFEIDQGSLDDIQLTAEGRIPELGSIRGTTLDFNIFIPDLNRASAFLAEEPLLLNLPVTATGQLISEDGFAVLNDVQIQLGSSRIQINGRLSTNESLSGSTLSIEASGPNLAEMIDLAELQTLPQDFSLNGQWQRTDNEDVISNMQLNLGSISASIDGSIDNLFAPSQLELAVQASGPDASVLNKLVGQSLPMEAFELTTRIEGSLQSFDLKNLQAKLGSNALSGELSIALAEPAGISGQLHSAFLDVSNWSAVDSTSSVTPPEQNSIPAAEFVFTDEPLVVINNSMLPVDVHLTIDEMVSGELNLKNIQIGIFLNERLLRLEPLQFEGVNNATFIGSIEFDGNGLKPVLTASIQAENFRLGIAAVEGQPLDTGPPADLFIDIRGVGSTYREMASSLDGRFQLQLEAGQMANFDRNLVLSDVIRELITILNPFAESRGYTNLDCAIVIADIKSGIATVEPIIIQTENVTILSSGIIDLKTENIDLAFNTRGRTGVGIGAGIVINPFVKLGGTMSAPNLELDPSGAVIFGGVAIATGGFSLLARTFTDRYLRDSNPCGTAAEELFR